MNTLYRQISWIGVFSMNKSNLVKKELFRSINKSRGQAVIIALMVFLTSFMYFFVQCSIDGNRKLLTQQQTDFETALNSNQILAGSFLAALIAISAFILFMFYRNYFLLHRKEIGCLKALGIPSRMISKACMLYTFWMSFPAAVAGMAAGWFASDILNRAYMDSYGVETVKKGIAVTSIFYGVILVPAVLVLLTFISGRKVLHQETALLIANSDSRKGNPLFDKLSDKIAGIIPERFRFQVRIALRKPLTVFLTFAAVMSAEVLFILSISLNLSSQEVYHSQIYNHNYEWDTRYETYLTDTNNPRTDAEEIRYLAEDVLLTVPGRYSGTISQTLIGLKEYGTPFMPADLKGNRLDMPSGNRIIISNELREVYGVHIGDTIKVGFNGTQYSCIVESIADNATLKSIYIGKDTLSSWIGREPDIYNGVLSMEKPAVPGVSVSKPERIEALKRAAVSNKTSAVINQVLGAVIGCLLIYLVILLNFSDSMGEILTLHLLGYRAKKINTMLVSIYRPILCAAYLIMLYPSIYLCSSIQRNLSIQTKDYMPFQTNVIVIILIFAVINIIYDLVKLFFGRKIQRIIDKEDIQEQLFQI